MTDFLHPENDFLQKVIQIIEENLSDEHFEVPDLAARLNMSRSSLLRKVKALSGYSVSVFIRQVRLHHAKELLKDDSFTVSEVSFKVGFNSTSYFTKCFRELFGYTPGEEKDRVEEEVSRSATSRNKEFRVKRLVIVTILVALVAVFLIPKNTSTEEALDKSIAVLPFNNDSDDPSNVYIINGLMETILDKLQKIEDLDVTSRTTVEKYREVKKTISEMSQELGVSYFVEGSGQKRGDEILLTIQLIDAKNDRHVWSKQYRKDTEDIFQLQLEVAKNIADQIEVIITPQEQKRIEKIPTENLEAYDLFLKGLDLTETDKPVDLEGAINYFEQALIEDETFALAYAYMAICHYFLDIFQANKTYGLDINVYADKALLYDEELPESLIAKALFYMQDEQYELATKYFEKALEYSPNSGWIHNQLSGIYSDFVPNTELYLKHAIRGIQVAISEQDSVEASYTYLHLGNALVENGFVKESEKYILKSTEYNSQNLFSEYVYTYIKLAQNFDLERAKEELKKTLAKDTARLDIIQEIAKVYYTLEDYEGSWFYYQKFLGVKQLFGLDIYNAEDIKIAFVLDQLGRKEEANELYNKFLTHAENDKTIYRSLNLCAYYAAKGDIDKGMQYLKEFTKVKGYFYWLVLFLDKDPIILQLSNHPDFDETIRKITDNFWEQHKQIKSHLSEEGLL